MSAIVGEFWPYVALIVVGFLPNEIWRWLGLIMARGLDERSEIVVWVRAIATAILAGVIAKLTLFPGGVLAAVPLWVRVGAVIGGFAAYLILGRSVLAGVLIGQALLIAGMLAFG